MIELLKKYEEEIKKQLDLNKQIDEILTSLDNKEKIVSFDFNLYKDLFIEANYSAEELRVIENNIKYVKFLITSEDFLSYDKFIKALKVKFKKLESLKLKKNEQEQLIKNYNLVSELKANLETTSSYIENIDFIFEIFTYFNIEFKDIKKYMNDIIKHNKKIYLSSQKDLILDDNEPSKDNFFTSIIKNINFTLEEKNILRSYYEKNPEYFEQKYNALKNIKELKYVFNNLEEQKKLFIILMVLSNIDIINNVISVCNSRGLKLHKMLPNIFVSKNTKFVGNSFEDEFYQLFTGSYEDFLNNLNYLNIGLDLSKIEPTYYITDGNLVRNNHSLLRKYGIDISIGDIECLTIENLEDKLNKIIESGLYSYFKDNPRKLLEIKDKAFFYRLKYAKRENIPYKRKHLVNELFLYNGYGIDETNYQEKLDLYTIPKFASLEFQQLDNIVILDNEIRTHFLLDLLDRLYKSDDNMSYNINGYIISKIKVIKKFNQFLKDNNNMQDNNNIFVGLIYAILDGVILTESETLVFIANLIKELKKVSLVELNDLSENVVGEILFSKTNSKGGI